MMWYTVDFISALIIHSTSDYGLRMLTYG